MSELSPEEKKKIYEEEKARLEAQDSLKKEAEKKKSQKQGMGCLIIIIAIAVIWLVGKLTPDKPKPASKPPAQEITLSANVRFDGAQFILTNNDSFDWTDVEIEINGGILRGGYVLNTDRIEANNTYKVGSMQFAKSDGTRFNPFAVKPQSIYISAKTPKGAAYYSGSWK